MTIFDLFFVIIYLKMQNLLHRLGTIHKDLRGEGASAKSVMVASGGSASPNGAMPLQLTKESHPKWRASRKESEICLGNRGGLVIRSQLTTLQFVFC